jgi:hypothetical protein
VPELRPFQWVGKPLPGVPPISAGPAWPTLLPPLSLLYRGPADKAASEAADLRGMEIVRFCPVLPDAAEADRSCRQLSSTGSTQSDRTWQEILESGYSLVDGGGRILVSGLQNWEEVQKVSATLQRKKPSVSALPMTTVESREDRPIVRSKRMKKRPVSGSRSPY